MDVSVILVSYNTKELTRNCLNSIYEKTKNVEFEVFVVDNNSHDGSADMVEQEFPQVRLIKNPDNKGFGAANNVAIKQSNAKYIFCLNTDTILTENSVKQFFDYMEQTENNKVGAVGGLLFDGNNNPSVCGGHFITIKEILWKFGLNKIFPKQYKKMSLVNYADEIENLKDIDYITGADIFFRKEVLDKVGIFDENFFMYYEETDLCKRIKDAGYDIKILQNIKIIHLESKSVTKSEWKQQQMYRSRFIYLKKHYKSLFLIIKLLYTIMFIFNPKYRKNDFLPNYFFDMWKL